MESAERNNLSKAEHDNYPTSGLGGPIRKLLTTLLHRKLVGMPHVQSFKEQSKLFWEISQLGNCYCTHGNAHSCTHKVKSCLTQ